MKPNTRLEEALRSSPPELKAYYRSLLSDQEESDSPPQFQTVAELKASEDFNASVPVTSTGWSDLDKITAGGLADGEVALLAAQSGAGKTHFAVNLALNYASQSLPVFYLTVEDGWKLIIQRFNQVDTRHSADDFVFMVHEDEVTMKNATAMIKKATEDAKLLIIDNLFALPLRQSSKGDYWMSQAEWVDDICNIVRSTSSSALILHHLNKEKNGTNVERYQISGSTRLQNRVAQVWLLHRPEDDPRLIAIKSEKNRRSPNKGECFLRSDDRGWLHGIASEDLAGKVRQHALGAFSNYI